MTGMREPITPVQLAMQALDFTLKAYRELAGFPDGVDDELVYETIAGRLAEVDRMRAALADRDAELNRTVVAALGRIEKVESELADRDAKIAAVRALAEEWRYGGEFGWGPWQEGYGPSPEDSVLDIASAEIRRALGEDSRVTTTREETIDEPPGMWERADYEGGLDEVRPASPPCQEDKP